MNYVGIDPSATATGLAYKAPDYAVKQSSTGVTRSNVSGVWQTAELSINEWKTMKDFLWYAYSADGMCKVMIEGQFAGINPKGALLLATVKGRIVQMAVEIGYEVEQVMPTTWQAAMLTLPPKAKSKDRKEASIIRAKEVTGDDIESDNIADAINIACYAELSGDE